MVLRGVIVFLIFIVEIQGECRFATQFFKVHDIKKDIEALCPGQVHLNCPPTKYRSYNGSCNNIDYPDWGMANMPLDRLLPAQYEDGFDAMRWKSVTGAPLPKARDLSITLFADDPNDKSPVFTFMHMNVGQFLDHDLTLLNFGENITGCGTDFCNRKGECAPIQIPCGDPDYHQKHCLTFIRSKPVFCGHNRDQTNTETAYIDASMVYGFNKDKVMQLRDLYHDRGQLTMSKHPYDWSLRPLMPLKTEPLCRGVGGPINCFDGGDPRINTIIGLQTFHVLFHRAHNTIENKLHYLNPHWCGERLFQESRKILGAIWQRIIYNEYIPLALGPETSHIYDLILEEGYNYWKGYNPHVKAGIFNEFTTGAFRFGHSQIPNKQRFTDALFHDFKEEFAALHSLRPAALFASGLLGSSGVDASLRGMADAPAYTVNLNYAKQMTANMFTEQPPFGEGTDLASLDIQRGRDHGLKSYNAWRRVCGLKTADCFDHLPDISPYRRQQLQSIYKDVEDIDLIAGGLAEQHMFGAMVGPTFACMMGKQFNKLRAGDRFWHENPDKMTGFTPDQLKQIRKYSLSYLICENGDAINKIQPKAMLQPMSRVPPEIKQKYGDLLNYLYLEGDNERIPCHKFHIPDLSPWKEDAGYDAPPCHAPY